MFKLHPVFISLVTAYGLMNPATQAWSAELKPFTPELNDNRVGVFCICNGTTQTLSGNLQFAPGLSGTVDVTLAQLQSSGRIITDDNAIGADRLTLGSQDYDVIVHDPATDTYSVFQTYNSAEISALAPVDLNAVVPDYVNVGDAQYINARVAQVSNGTINVNIGEQGAGTTAATNGWIMAAKQSQLFTASGTGTMNWDSDNRITFNSITPPPGDRLAYQINDIVNYSGTFTVTTLDNNTTSFNVTNLSELQSYNNWLIDQLSSGNLSANSYNSDFNKALTLKTGSVVYTMSANDPDDDVAQAIGDRVVLSADGPHAKVTVQAGKTLEVVNASNGAVRGTNGATVVIDGKLASSGSTASDNNAIELTNGSKATNNGVINGGFFNQADGSGVDASTLGYSGKTVYLLGNSRFVNNGVINTALSENAPAADSAAIWLAGSSAVNNGNINVGVANSTASQAAAGVVLSTDDASFINAAGGTLYIGRTPQNSLAESTSDVALNPGGTISGTSQVLNSSVINNGHIVIGSGVQNAVAMKVQNGPQATMLNNGTIDINGRAQFQPAENIGMLVIDSGTGGLIGNTGTINLNGDNSTGIKVIATDGNSASAFSNGTINVTGRADDANGTRNTAVWVTGQDGGNASATLTGPIALSGEAAIGIRADGNATVNVARTAVPSSGGGQYQINFLATGPNAKITLPVDGSYAVSSWHSTIFRYQDGADFDGAGLTFTPDASFSTGVMGSGTGTDITTHGATINIGLYSTGVLVEGGAQGTIDAATTLNMNSINSNAATVDGNKHALNGVITNSIAHPYANTSLTNHAAINGVYDGQLGLIALNQAQLTNTGDINLAGNSTTGISALYGASVVNSGDISVSNSGTGIYAYGDNISGDGMTPTVVTNSGTINVGGTTDAILRTVGVVANESAAVINQNGTLNLYGANVLGGEAVYGGTLNLGSGSTVVFHDPNQTGYESVEGGGNIVSNGSTYDVSTAGSTLYRLAGGAIFYPLATSNITLSGANTLGISASGVGTTLFGSDNYTVNGEGATAVRIANGALGTLSNAVTLNGNNSTGAVSESGGAALYASSSVTGNGANITAFQVGDGARIENRGQVDLNGANNTAARLYNGGNFINYGSMRVASGTGVDVTEGYGQYVPYDSNLSVVDGRAAMRVGNNAVLNVIGDGLYHSIVAGGGSADGILVDNGALGLTASDIIIGAYGTGSVINNRAETDQISLNNVFLDVGAGNGIRSATSFDYNGRAYINVTGGGTGYRFANADGSTTSNDLVIGPDYTIFVSGNGTGVRANTTGRVINDGFIAMYDLNGGSAIVTSTASEVINRGSIFSFSTVAPIIDLRGGNAVFINEGQLTAPNPETVVVAGGAGSDRIALVGGQVVGDVNTGSGTDTVAITGGTLNGSVTLGSGENNQALVKGVGLANVSHITSGGGAGSTLTLADIDARGGSFNGDDDPNKGVNLGAGWSTLNFRHTDWTLTDNLKLAHSTINIDPDSTLYVGNSVNPVLQGGSSDSLVVNNAGTLDLTNGNGAPVNRLTIDGELASAGGSIKMRTLLNAGGALSLQQSDTVRINGTASGTTLIDDAITQGSTAPLTDVNHNGVIEAGEGISLAQVSGDASSHSFALKGGYLAAGPWQYSLYSFAPGSSDASQRLVNGTGDQYWDYRLANTFVSEDGSLFQPQAGTRQTAARPAVVPQLPSYLSAPVGLAYYTMATVDDLHKRLGELRHEENSASGTGGEMFIRYNGANLTYKTNLDLSHYGYDFDLDYSSVQIGGNLLKLDGEKDSLRAGIAYTRGNTRIRPHAADGYSSTTFDSDSVALYGTWQHNKGFYLDGALSMDWHSGDTDIARQKDVAKVKGKGWTASLESGYPLALGSGVRLEPQAQVLYLHLNMDNLTDEDGATVDYGNYDQTIGRVGARLDRTWQDEAERQYTPYLRTHLSRGWGGTAKATVGAQNTDISQNFYSGKFGQMWDIGVGGTTTFKNNVSLYAETNYQKEIDGNGAKGWNYNAGVRWTF